MALRDTAGRPVHPSRRALARRQQQPVSDEDARAPRRQRPRAVRSRSRHGRSVAAQRSARWACRSTDRKSLLAPLLVSRSPCEDPAGLRWRSLRSGRSPHLGGNTHLGRQRGLPPRTPASRRSARGATDQTAPAASAVDTGPPGRVTRLALPPAVVRAPLSAAAWSTRYSLAGTSWSSSTWQPWPFRDSVTYRGEPPPEPAGSAGSW